MKRPRPWNYHARNPVGAPRQRDDFVNYLRAYGRADADYGAAELIFGELLVNVLLHAPGSVDVQVEWLSGNATLHVTDEGPPIDMDCSREPETFSEHGRGLNLVCALSPAVAGTIYPGYGKTITAELPVGCRPGVGAAPTRLRMGGPFAMGTTCFSKSSSVTKPSSIAAVFNVRFLSDA